MPNESTSPGALFLICHPDIKGDVFPVKFKFLKIYVLTSDLF